MNILKFGEGKVLMQSGSNKEFGTVLALSRTTVEGDFDSYVPESVVFLQFPKKEDLLELIEFLQEEADDFPA